tara:strand:- start:56 stop:235 length:180 start_codon:yes stop_codon:yes gene_type:complete
VPVQKVRVLKKGPVQKFRGFLKNQKGPVQQEFRVIFEEKKVRLQSSVLKKKTIPLKKFR